MFRGPDRRRRQKRRGGDEKRTAAAAPAQAPRFEVELCELVDVGGGEALLRAAGRWSPAPPERVDLVSFGNGAIERIEPLPPGAALAADGLWHVAFCVAEAATTAHLALMTPAGVAVGLPAPARLLPIPIGPSAHDEELAAERSARAEAEERADEGGVAAARAARETLAEREKFEEAARQAGVYRERLAKAEREVAATREELTKAYALAGDAGGLVDALEAESARADEATRRVEAVERDLAAARAELAATEQRADEAIRRSAEAEWQLADVRARLVEAETAAGGEPTPSQAVIETDLRHLLEKRERELEAARAELAEQRTRYAAVASEVPAAEEPPVEAIDPEKAEPWSRVDDDLLERLARAKSLAGGQD